MVKVTEEKGKKTREKFDNRTGKILREGEYNRNRIFDFIYANRESGTQPRDIIREVKLSKESVHNHLRVLSDEKRIYKMERRYFPESSVLNEVAAFSQHMSILMPHLLDKDLMEPSHYYEILVKDIPKQKLHQKIKINLPNKLSTPRDLALLPNLWDYLLKLVLGSIISKEYCKTSLGPRKLMDKYLFEFSNRIGAFITYIFLQSLYPLENLDVSIQERSQLCATVIEKSISLEDLFDGFRRLIVQLGLCNYDQKSNYLQIFELDNKNFKTISRGIRSIYPNLYDGLENSWFNSIDVTHALNQSKYERKMPDYIVPNFITLNDKKYRAHFPCRHSWKEHNYFKYGGCRVCTKCHVQLKK